MRRASVLDHFLGATYARRLHEAGIEDLLTMYETGEAASREVYSE